MTNRFSKYDMRASLMANMGGDFHFNGKDFGVKTQRPQYKVHPNLQAIRPTYYRPLTPDEANSPEFMRYAKTVSGALFRPRAQGFSARGSLKRVILPIHPRFAYVISNEMIATPNSSYFSNYEYSPINESVVHFASH